MGQGYPYSKLLEMQRDKIKEKEAKKEKPKTEETKTPKSKLAE